MNDIKISCIVPVYNTEKYIVKCITSILNQTYNNLELILVDDGSSDTSGKICDEYGNIDSRIKVIHQKNAGVSAARNVGIEQATGDYITFIDSDDYIEEDYFTLAINYLKLYNPSLMLNNYIKHKDKTQGKRYPDKVQCYDNYETVCKMFAKTHIDFGVPACFYKTANLKNIKFDTQIRYGEDLLFKYNFIKSIADDILYVPIQKYHYAFRADSACNSYNLLKKADDLKVFRLIMEQEDHVIKELVWKNEYLPRLIKYYKIGMASNCSEERKLAKELKNELRTSLWKILLDLNVKIALKAKVCFYLCKA